MRFSRIHGISFVFIFIGLTFFFAALNWSVKLNHMQSAKFAVIGFLYTTYGFIFYRILKGMFTVDQWEKKVTHFWSWLWWISSIPIVVYMLVYALLPQIGINFDSGKYPFSLLQFLFRLIVPIFLVNVVPLSIVGIKAFFNYLIAQRSAKKLKKKSKQLKVETTVLQNQIERYVHQMESRHIAPHFVKNFVGLSYQQNLSHDHKLMEAYFVEFTTLMSYMLDSDHFDKGVSAEDECDMIRSFTKLICLVYGEQAVQFNKPLQGWEGSIPAGLLLLPVENALKYGIWRKGQCGLYVHWERDETKVSLKFTNRYDPVKRKKMPSLGTGFSLMQHKIDAHKWPIKILHRDVDQVFVFQIKINRL